MNLDDLPIATPCPASWAAMEGDDRRRFCGECRLHVYNLSAMTRKQATDFLQDHEGRVCVRLYRRVDGTVITRDCPVGVAREQRGRLGRLAAATLLVASMAYWVATALLTGESGLARFFDQVCSGFAPHVTMGTPAPLRPQEPEMGIVAPEPQQPR